MDPPVATGMSEQGFSRRKCIQRYDCTINIVVLIIIIIIKPPLVIARAA